MSSFSVVWVECLNHCVFLFHTIILAPFFLKEANNSVVNCVFKYDGFICELQSDGILKLNSYFICLFVSTSLMKKIHEIIAAI